LRHNEAQHKAEVEAWKNGPDACKHVGDGEPKHSFSERWNAHVSASTKWEATKVEKIAAWKRGENVRLPRHL